MYKQEDDCYEELAHAIVEAEKLYSLPSANWKPRKAGGIIQSRSKGLRNSRANEVDSSLDLTT